MNIPENQQVSNIEAIISSIITDKQVFRWFTLLAVQPDIKAKLLSVENFSKIYEQLKETVFYQRISYASVILLLTTLLITKQYAYLFIGILFIYPFIKLNSLKKNCVVKISEYLLKNDFEAEELCKKTLYQICEIYARKYNIPSLVDAIYATDNISRKTIIFTFVFTVFIYPFSNIWHIFLAIIVAYHTINALVNSAAIYKHLK